MTASDLDAAGMAFQENHRRLFGIAYRLAARIPVAGQNRVAKFVAAFSSHFWNGKTIGWVEVNGQPAVTLTEDGVITTTLTLVCGPGGISRLLWIMSPDKLRHVANEGA